MHIWQLVLVLWLLWELGNLHILSLQQCLQVVTVCGFSENSLLSSFLTHSSVLGSEASDVCG